MNALVIMNPRARRAQRELLGLKAAIADAPALSRPEIVLTGSAEEATNRAAAAVDEGLDLVVAAGGDGTVHAVVNGLMKPEAGEPGDGGDGGREARPALAVLPLGTGNDLARSLGLPRGPREALAGLASARREAMDLIRVRTDDGSVFHCANAVSGGFGGRVEEAMTDEQKEALGPLAYLRAALRMLTELGFYRLRVRLADDEEVRLAAYGVVVSNGRYAAGGIPVAPRARADDGLLDVLLIPAAGLADAGVLAGQVAAGTHLEESERVRSFRVPRLRIVSEPGMLYSMDGELSGPERSVSLAVVPGALRVLAGDRKGKAL